MNKISWIVFTVITAGFLAALIIFSGGSKLNVDKIDFLTIQKGGSQNGNIADHVFGKAGSKVTLIEYGDFQCPACGQAHPIIKSVTEQYKDQLQFVFRNFPITTIHANAKAAAGAAEAAGLQGRYWEIHNKIYESQSAWSELNVTDRTTLFVSYAKALKLDIAKFNTDAASTSVSDKIDYDYALGKKAGVTGTPTLILNGTKLDSSVTNDETKLKAAIDKELGKAGIALPEAVK